MKRSKKKNEKRRHIRVQPEKKRPVEININGQNFLTIIYANDISEGGIGIIVPEKFKGCKINNNVSLVITLPAPFKKSFLVTGRIIHVINEKFGVEFLDLTKENRKILKKYINSRLKEKPGLQKQHHIFRLILIGNISIGTIGLIFLGNLIYSSKTKEDIHLPAETKQIIQKIKPDITDTDTDTDTIQEIQEEMPSNDVEFQQYDNNQEVDLIDQDLDQTDNHSYIVRYNEPEPEDNSQTGNEYDSVFISDIAGKKIKLRGGKWFYFHYNNTVGINTSKSSDTSYFYAPSYYVEDNQIVIEVSYEEKAVISFSGDTISTNDPCSFEKIVEEEQVSKKDMVVSKIVDID